MRRLSVFHAAVFVLAFATSRAATPEPPATPTPATAEDKRPSLFIAGDSTAAEGGTDSVGWGRPVASFFDPARVRVVNRARGGRSSRTFVTEGLWDQLVAEIRPGDVVLVQFGHNDGGPVNDDRRARGSLKGLGDESEEIDNQITKKHEVVHTYGFYMRRMLDDLKAKGAAAILLSLTVRNIWKDGHVERGSGEYGAWTRALAEKAGLPFVDLTALVADHYQAIGAEKTGSLFPKDHTHTGEAGAEVNASFVVAGLKALRVEGLAGWLSEKGRAVAAAPETAVAGARPAPTLDERLRRLNLPEPAGLKRPSLFLVGDSTVRNGAGTGRAANGAGAIRCRPTSTRPGSTSSTGRWGA